MSPARSGAGQAVPAIRGRVRLARRLGARSWQTCRVRHWLSARALALGALALLLIVPMVALGMWQLGVYDAQQVQDARSRLRQPPTPLDRVLGPDAPFPAEAVGRPVSVSGRYVADEQIYVRDLAGSADAYAATTPLLTPAGSMILVVRGSTDELGGDPPDGTVAVRGVLEPSSASAGPLGASRVTDGLRIPSLIDGFGADLYAGYIVLTASEPADPLTRVDPPLPEPSTWVGLRNLLYAVQWWVFAGFVGFMWWRVVSDYDEVEPTDEPSHGRDAGSVSTTGVR